MQHDERQLLARCRQGEAPAWDELFDRYYAATGRFIFQLGYQFTRPDVEEICQEVFLTVIRHLETFRGQCQFQTWLFRIASNKSRDYRQRQTAAKRGGGRIPVSLRTDNSEGEYSVDPPSGLPGPDLILMRTENLNLVGRALEELGEPCREIISLRYFGELSYEEIANSLTLNPKTVSSRLSKCLDKLRTIVRELMGREKNLASSV